jgi:hypothetical protein
VSLSFVSCVIRDLGEVSIYMVSVVESSPTREKLRDPKRWGLNTVMFMMHCDAPK